MFGLYFSKKYKIIKIEKLKHRDMINRIIDGEIAMFNDCYYVSNDKNLLRQKGKDILQDWIHEAEEELLRLQEIKIKG